MFFGDGNKWTVGIELDGQTLGWIFLVTFASRWVFFFLPVFVAMIICSTTSIFYRMDFVFSGMFRSFIGENTKFMRKEVVLTTKVVDKLAALAKKNNVKMRPYMESVFNNLAAQVFHQGDIIKHKDKKYQCICSNNDTAVLAPISGTKTSYKNMFAVSNTEKLLAAFDYEKVK